MAHKLTQKNLFKKSTDRYGGSLLNTRKGRSHGRPISTKHSMHFVLRSTKAKGAWSFRRHRKSIAEILSRFAIKNGVKIESFANVGNHLHLHIKLSNRYTYKPFIRAITAAIMMKVTGTSRWAQYEMQSAGVSGNVRGDARGDVRGGARSVTSDEVRGGARSSAHQNESKSASKRKSNRFWDLRPYSRIVAGFKAALTLRDYIMINKYEGFNYDRGEATFLMRLNTGKLNSS